MKKKKLRKEIWFVIAGAILICVFFIWKTFSANDDSKNQSSESDVSLIENEGDVEIIIPDDMEQGGF